MKTSYNYRLLAAVDASINAGKDFLIGKGWLPLVQVGISLEFSRIDLSEDEYRCFDVSDYRRATSCSVTRKDL